MLCGFGGASMPCQQDFKLCTAGQVPSSPQATAGSVECVWLHKPRAGLWRDRGWPAGVESGQRLSISGQGGPPPKGVKGGQPGDLLVEVEVEPSRDFQRHGFDIITHASVDFVDAILGTTIRCAALAAAQTWTKPCTLLQLPRVASIACQGTCWL